MNVDVIPLGKSGLLAIAMVVYWRVRFVSHGFLTVHWPPPSTGLL